MKDLIKDLIETYQLEIKNIRLNIAKLKRKEETLHNYIMYLESMNQENERG